MKREHIIILILAIITCCQDIHAQRYLSGQKGIQATGGIVDGGKDNFYVGIAYSIYNKNKTRWVSQLEYLHIQSPYRKKTIPVDQYLYEIGYYVPVFSDPRRVVFFSLGLSGVAGYESINKNRSVLNDGARITDKSSFVGGAAVNLETEIFINDRFAILFHVKERGLWGGDTRNFHTGIGAGIKYIIN